MEAAKKNIARLELVEGVPVVDIEGEVDLLNVGELDDRLRTAGQHDAGAVIVSLEKATYFDSAAIHALIASRARLATSRQGFLIVQPATSGGRRILEIAGLMRDETHFATRDEAIERAKELTAERRA